MVISLSYSVALLFRTNGEVEITMKRGVIWWWYDKLLFLYVLRKDYKRTHTATIC